MILIFIPLVLILTAAGFALGKYSTKSVPFAPPAEISPQPTLPLTPTPGLTANWQSYKLETIGLSFKLPPVLGNLGELKESITSGEKGTSLCMTFTKKTTFSVRQVLAGGAACGVNLFGLGTTSADFEAGREGLFTDLQGYTKENGQYFAILVGKRIEIAPGLVQEIDNPNGLKILKITGKNSTGGEWRGPISGTPGEGRIGALLNTDNHQYPGLAVEMELTNNLTQDLFNQILSTFKLTGKTGQQQQECIGEGQPLGPGEVIAGKKCCPELIEISCDEPDQNGECPLVGGDCAKCTFCGDGKCGVSENKCNCPQDCK